MCNEILFSDGTSTTDRFKHFKSYVSFFGQLPKKLASMRNQFLEMTDNVHLDASKASSCPDGIPVLVIASAKAPERKVTPRILITAKRRGWPVVSHQWMDACLKAKTVVPHNEYLIDYSQLKLRVTSIKAVSL